MDTFPRHPVIPNLSRWPWMSCSPCFLFRLEFPELKMPCQSGFPNRAASILGFFRAGRSNHTSFGPPRWWGKVREIPGYFSKIQVRELLDFDQIHGKLYLYLTYFNLTYVNCETTWMELLWRCYNPEISGNCSRKALSSELTFDVMSMSMERIKKTERILYRYSKVL